MRPVFLLFEGDGPCDGSACHRRLAAPLVCICFCCTVRRRALAALAAVCALLFLLRRPILRRAAVCVLGLLAGFAWCRGYEALFLRPFADLSGETAAFSAQALAAPQESSYGQSVSARLTLDGKSCMAVIYFDEADGEILPEASCPARQSSPRRRKSICAARITICRAAYS